MTLRMETESVSTGFHTISAEILPEAVSVRWICCDWFATWSSVSGPYRCWLPVRNHNWGLAAVDMAGSPRGSTGSGLPVHVLVAGVESVDVVLLDGVGLAELVCDVDGAGDVLQHHRGLHRGTRVAADRERAVVAHQHGGGPAVPQGLHDALPDGVV